MGKPLRRMVGGALAVMLALGEHAAYAANEGSFCTFQGASSLLQLNGNTTLASNLLRLVPNTTSQTGSAFLTAPFALDATTSFHTHFRFLLSPGSTTGEGFTFTVQNAATGASTIGGGTTGLGYSGITPSLAVEFDTDQNSGDPNGNHIAVRANGSTTHLVSATSIPTLVGTTYDAWIDYDGAANHILVYLATTATKPAVAAIDYTNAAIDLGGLGAQAYAGFTGSTFNVGHDNQEDISYWVFSTGSSVNECKVCATSTDCAGQVSAPVCDLTRLQCVACASDQGGASLACPSASLPACETSGALAGQCTQCSATKSNLCTGATPTCDLTTGTCGSCNGDNASGASRACPSSALPACQASGTCTACSSTNLAQCGNPTPSCNASGACAICNGDKGSAASQPCPSALLPACEASGVCGQCSLSSSSLCAGTTPLCNTATGVCAGCNGNQGSAASRACPTIAAPACLPSGACGQCSTARIDQCGASTPACDSPSGTCVACNGNQGSATTHACPSAAAPGCQASGACTQCAANDLALCGGQTPTCGGGVCVACDGDFAGATPQACPTTSSPYCFVTSGAVGACGKCTSSLECAGHPAGAVCNPLTGSCGTVCASDVNCTQVQWCHINVCTPKTPNGEAVPATCSASVAARVCLSGTCEVLDNLCGLANGSACGPSDDAGGGDGGPTAGDRMCRSGLCIDGLCGQPTGGACTSSNDCRSKKCNKGVCVACTADIECGTVSSARVCDDTTGTCADGCRGIGNGCHIGDVCSSTTTAVGVCSHPSDPDSGPFLMDAGLPSTEAGLPGEDDSALRGGGLTCSASAPSRDQSRAGFAASIAALVLLGARRRRR